jgi:hypothetical protein
MKVKLIAALRLIVSVGVLALTIAGQQPSSGQPNAQGSLTGKYEGTARDSTGEAKVTLDLVDESGKFSGTVTTQLGVFKLVKGQMVDGLLSLELETKAPRPRLSLRLKDDKLVGTLLDGVKTADIELRKAAKDELSGEWDAAADAQGQAFPFTLMLKLDGDKVTGSSSSELGNSTISSGTFKDGKLALVLESANGQTALIGAMVDGKLVGDYDYNGQLSGKWVATKKKP